LLCNELRSCKLPLSDLLHIAPYIQPRYYTISSSSSVYPNTVHITVRLTEFPAKTTNSSSSDSSSCNSSSSSNSSSSARMEFTGLASGFFKRICEQGADYLDSRDTTRAATPPSESSFVPRIGKKDVVLSTCRVFVRPTAFRLPPSLETPVIMVGVGTGLAPMRGMLQERWFLASDADAPTATVDNTLYFGCKYSSVDFIYKDELEELHADNTLLAFHTAFSRDHNDDDTKQKEYEQDVLSKPANAFLLVTQLVWQGAYFYVCGATAMGNDVHATVTRLLTSYEGMNPVAAAAFVKDMQETGRYVQELWTSW
jgi:NADPH-ferrihemoprotein reductase